MSTSETYRPSKFGPEVWTAYDRRGLVARVIDRAITARLHRVTNAALVVELDRRGMVPNKPDNDDG